MLILHQALHGYLDGHRQLAASIDLPSKDARLLMVMSDVSGPGVTSLGIPYITGYPLTDSGYYALAKTWPAPETERPGCVWTHTLLVSFTDLGALASPSIIAKLFLRPSLLKSQHADYAFEIRADLDKDQASKPLSTTGVDWFARIANAIYAYPDAQVWARRMDEAEIDDAILRLWDQQWPRLKRSFKFCTLASRDRSQEGLLFDLQLMPGGRGISHPRFSLAKESVEATARSEEPWLQDLVKDAQWSLGSSLRPFLRRLGADMLCGREAMQPFCSLHAALETPGLDGLLDAVTLVEKTSPFASSDLVKTIVAQTAIEYLTSANDQIFDFVIGSLPILADETIISHQDTMARLLWERDPWRLIALSKDPRKAVHDAIHAGAKAIPHSAVIRQLPQVKDLGESILELIPSIAENSYFWSCTQLHPLTAVKVGIELSHPAVLRAMILGLQDPMLIQIAIQEIGGLSVLMALQNIAVKEKNHDQIRLWLRFACVDTSSVAEFLAGAVPPVGEMQALISRELQPDAVPNDYGVDPWYLALNTLALIEDSMPAGLLVYGFRRALGRRTRSAGDLLKLTFEPLHSAAEKGAIPEELWRLVDGALPKPPFGREWDRAVRLRMATAKKCYELKIKAGDLANLVSSDILFEMLLDEIWDPFGGARYLRSVAEELSQSSNNVDARRGRQLSGFLKKHAKLW